VLNERQGTGLLYDSVTDVTRVFVATPPGTVRTHTVAADLLLDAEGFLVGIDIDPDAPTRAVVMVGPHERVASRVPMRVGVCSDAGGDVFEVRIGGAGAAVRGDQKNPYL
jgi:hypothetical protein